MYFPLQQSLLLPEQLPGFMAQHTEQLLGLVHYAPPGVADLTHKKIPVARVYKTVLGRQPSLIEAWYTDEPVREMAFDGGQCAGNDQLIWGVLEYPASTAAMRDAAYRIYQALLAGLKQSGYPHLVRVWNAIPDIHGLEHGLERYRAFNLGRNQAFVEAGVSTQAGAPAATALGTPAGPLLVYFLAGKTAPLAVENPRQVSAYHYPRQYGPQAPSFSRAAVFSSAAGSMLLVSGTASIVGHESCHIGDVKEQTNESLRNVQAVLQQAALLHCSQLSDLHFKVYIRNAHDYAAVSAQMQQHGLHPANTLYLEADICREELLMELEAIGPARQIAKL